MGQFPVKIPGQISVVIDNKDALGRVQAHLLWQRQSSGPNGFVI